MLTWEWRAQERAKQYKDMTAAQLRAELVLRDKQLQHEREENYVARQVETQEATRATTRKVLMEKKYHNLKVNVLNCSSPEISSPSSDSPTDSPDERTEARKQFWSDELWKGIKVDRTIGIRRAAADLEEHARRFSVRSIAKPAVGFAEEEVRGGAKGGGGKGKGGKGKELCGEDAAAGDGSEDMDKQKWKKR